MNGKMIDTWEREFRSTGNLCLNRSKHRNTPTHRCGIRKSNEAQKEAPKETWQLIDQDANISVIQSHTNKCMEKWV